MYFGLKYNEAAAFYKHSNLRIFPVCVH